MEQDQVIPALIMREEKRLRARLVHFQPRFQEATVLARLLLQIKTSARMYLNLCRKEKSLASYDALSFFAFLVSDFSLALRKIDQDTSDGLARLSLHLHNATRFNRRRISAGHI